MKTLIGRIINDDYDKYILTATTGKTILLYDDMNLVHYTIKPCERMVYMVRGNDLKISDITQSIDDYYARVTAQDDEYKVKITLTHINSNIMATTCLYQRRWFLKPKLIHIGQYNVDIRD